MGPQDKASILEKLDRIHEAFENQDLPKQRLAELEAIVLELKSILTGKMGEAGVTEKLRRTEDTLKAVLAEFHEMKKSHDSLAIAVENRKRETILALIGLVGGVVGVILKK